MCSDGIVNSGKYTFLSFFFRYIVSFWFFSLPCQSGLYLFIKRKPDCAFLKFKTIKIFGFGLETFSLQLVFLELSYKKMSSA